MSTSFPDEIKVSGLPFMLQGWNTKFYKSVRTHTYNGLKYPVYRLDPYVLYWLYDIAGGEIRVSDEGIWGFYKDGCTTALYTKRDTGDQSTPMGKWTYHNMKITNVEYSDENTDDD